MPYADKAVQAGATVRQRAVPDVRALDDLAQAGRWVVTGGGQSTTAATPAGNCWQCGGQLYENLFHSCTTSVAPSVSRPTGKPDTNDPVYVIGAAQIDLLNLLLAHGEYAQADALVDRWATRIDHEIAESIRAKIARAGGGS